MVLSFAKAYLAAQEAQNQARQPRAAAVAPDPKPDDSKAASRNSPGPTISRRAPRSSSPPRYNAPVSTRPPAPPAPPAIPPCVKLFIRGDLRLGWSPEGLHPMPAPDEIMRAAGAVVLAVESVQPSSKNG